MKLKHYIAVVIFGCLASGLTIDYVLTKQFSGLASLSRDHNSNRIARMQHSHLQRSLSQFLVMSDLILASGETYLIDGALRQHQLLEEEIDALLETGDIPLQDRYLALKDSLATIAGLLADAAIYENEDRQAALNALLDTYDVFATNIAYDSELVAMHLDKATTTSAERLTDEQRFAKIVQIAVGVGFFLLVLGSWRWLSQAISKPIQVLSERATETQAKESFIGISSGPAEVRALSDRFEALTAELVHQATHDPLTNLVNRREFERRLTKLTSTRRDATSNAVLCYIDLDRFKIVNDTCGHAAGDTLLNMVAETFTSGVREEDVVARLGGDEFCILLRGCDLPAGMDIVESLRSAVEALRFHFDDQVFRISASIGVAELDQKTTSADHVVEQADAACAVAKESGRNRIYVFDLHDEKVDQRRLDISWVNQLTAAMDEQRLVLFKQRIVPIGPDKEVGDRFELLIRMRDTEGNLIPPSRFMPVAERFHMSVRIDKWVLSTALEWLVRNPLSLQSLASLSVNVSGQSLSQASFRIFARDAIAKSIVPGSKICFEITETEAISDITNAQVFIEELGQLNCQFALDDFGTGRATFAYLRDLPVQILKIDGSFIRDYLVNKVDQATVRSLVDVAKASGKKVVAEFVESQELLSAMGALGVDYAQGYFCGKPHEVGEDYTIECTDVINL